MASKPNKKPTPKPIPETKEIVQKWKTRQAVSVNVKLAFLLGLISFIVYANTLKNGFVLDDFYSITENSIVTKGVSAIPQILITPYRRGYFITTNDLYRPLSLVTFAIEYQLFGNFPAAYHFFNILLFAGCVIVLFIFLDKIFERKKTAVAFITALLFALHPIHTEVVANIKSRDELLCFFFAFLSLNLFIQYVQAGKILQLVAGSFCILLSLLSKETTITFIVIIPLIFFFYRDENRKRSTYITGSTLFVAAIYLIIRFSVLNYYHANDVTKIPFIDNVLTKAGLPYESRTATAILILGYYIKLLFVPYPLICDYSYNSIPLVHLGDPKVLISLFIYVLLAVFSIKRLLKNNKDPFAFGILFFLIAVSLFSNIPFLIGSVMGERFLFFPSVGFCLLAALAIEKWLARSELSYPSFLKNTYVMATLIPVCLIFTCLTISRNNDWKDNYTLFKADLEKSPNNSRLNCYYGKEIVKNAAAMEKDTLKKIETVKEGIPFLEKAIELYPDYADWYVELGCAYSLIFNYDSAELCFRNAFRLNPGDDNVIKNLSSVYNNKSTVCNGKKDYSQAIKFCKLAIGFNPNNKSAEFNLGCNYIQTRQYDSAVYHLNRTLVLDPGFPGVNMQLGFAYFNAQKYNMAEKYFNKEIELSPKNLDAVNNLGAACIQSGEFSMAIETFKKAIMINPNYVNAYSGIGICYQRLSKYDSAIFYLNKAISIDPAFNAPYGILVIIYKATGNLDSAKKYAAIAERNNQH